MTLTKFLSRGDSNTCDVLKKLLSLPEEFWSLVIRSSSRSAIAFLYSSSSSWQRILGSSIRDSKHAFPNPELGTMWRGTSTRAYLSNAQNIFNYCKTHRIHSLNIKRLNNYIQPNIKHLKYNYLRNMNKNWHTW